MRSATPYAQPPSPSSDPPPDKDGKGPAQPAAPPASHAGQAPEAPAATSAGAELSLGAPMGPRLSPPAKIALSFLAFGVLWILISDTLVEAAFPDAGGSPPAQTIKGLAFVALSTLLVLLLARREHLRERERATLAAALEQTAEGIALTDTDGRVTYVNPAFCNTTGFEPGDVIGQIPTQDTAFRRARWVELAIDHPWKGRVTHYRKGGQSYTADLLISRIAVHGTARFVVIERDVSREEELERELLQSQKMDAIGRLAGGIAHDFNNILTAISGYTSLAIEELAVDSPARADLGQVVDAAGRAADLTRQLLGFARKQTAQPKVLDLGRTIVPMLELLRRVIGENIKLEARFDECWPIRIDPTQLDQIITNLVLNARDAIKGLGVIRVSVRNHTLMADHPSHRAGEYVQLEVTDDGQGMAAETLDRIFEPFFTTKAEGSGTGLGLATVYGIVEQNGGLIDVRSELGNGTTFFVNLPHHLGIPTQRETRPTRPATASSGRILLVEDDALLRSLVERLLTSAGHSVLTAASPAAALELAGVHPFDLLLTDVIMPGMNGHELHLALLAEHQGLRCLFMSGYPRDVVATHGLLDPGVELLTKPFSHDALVRRVADVLARH